MRKISLRLLAILALGIAFTEAAHADDWTFYIGAAAGRTKTSDGGCIYVDDIFSPSKCDRSNSSSGFQIGLEFDKYWAIEGGWKTLGRIADQNDGEGNYSIIKTKLVELELVAQWPIWKVVPYLKGGGYFARNALDSTIVPPANGNQAGWTYGAGIGFDVTKNIRVRAEWQRYNNVGHANVGFRADVETSTLGAVLRF